MAKPGGSGSNTKPPYTGPKVGAYDRDGDPTYLCAYVMKRCGQTTKPFMEPNNCITGIDPNYAVGKGYTLQFPASWPSENPSVVKAVDAWLAWSKGEEQPTPVEPTPEPQPSPQPQPTPAPQPQPPGAPSGAQPVGTFGAVCDAIDAFCVAWRAYRGAA